MNEEMTVRQNIINTNNISYYNEIAANYDALLKLDTSNERVRKVVAGKFLSMVPKGWILDFGAGTGLDSNWLLQKGYQIIFCEPSTAMRKIAIQNSISNQSNILFLENPATDFRTWGAALPFEEQVESVLMNFAVMNCIADIGLLFENLSLVTKTGAKIFALVLNNNIGALVKKSLFKTFKHLFFNKSFAYSIKYHNHWQTVYIHTEKEIKKAITPYFLFTTSEAIKGSGFTLLQLTKK
jgi:SAM-dependent methyltransferase